MESPITSITNNAINCYDQHRNKRSNDKLLQFFIFFFRTRKYTNAFQQQDCSKIETTYYVSHNLKFCQNNPMEFWTQSIMQENSDIDRNNTISICQKSDTSKYTISAHFKKYSVDKWGIPLTISIFSKQKILHESESYMYLQHVFMSK